MDKEKECVVVNYKPVFPQLLIALLGCACVYFGHIASILLGLFLVGLSLLVQFGVKDYHLFDIYDDRLAIYDPNSGSVEETIPFSDIEEWNINRAKPYSLYLRLKDGRQILRETYQIAKVNKALRKYIDKKESIQLQKELNKNKKLTFRNPFKRRKKMEKVDIKKLYLDILKEQIENVYDDQSDKIKEAAEMICDTMTNGGVVQLFGFNHANEFVNELNFRAGGMAPYHGMSVSILDLEGEAPHAIISDGSIANDPSYIDKMLAHYKLDDRDMLIVVSKDASERFTLELAKRYKANGQKVIAVVNKKSYDVKAIGDQGEKLLDIADMYLDMGSTRSDITIKVDDLRVAQTSSTVANVLAQMLTAEVYNCFKERGLEAPVLLSANLKGADLHNNALTDVYMGRVR